MTKSNRPGNMKARVGIAAAVLVGGAAVGVTAVAASGHGTSASAQSAGYSMNTRHSMNAGRAMPMGMAMSSALASLRNGQQGKALTSMASMATMKNFAQARHHGVTMAMQRGVVELATKRFLVVKSANGQQHLWWVHGARIVNAASAKTAMTAMTGSTSPAGAMTAPAVKPTTITVNAGGQTITITISGSTATVSAPAATPSAMASTAPATPTASAGTMPSASSSSSSGSQMTTSAQSVFARGNGLKRGDLVLVTGVRRHGLLVAKLVLFAAPTTMTTTPTATPTASASATPTSAATAPASTPATSASTSQFAGTHS